LSGSKGYEMSHIEAVCISKKKGIIKKEIPKASVKEDWGIEGDAHAGRWHRQISLLAGESIDKVRDTIPGLRHGVFAENIVTRGIDLSTLNVGDRLIIGGEVILEITQLGKKCHKAGCAIKKLTGDCIMPREGLFAKVIRGGNIEGGLPITLSDI